MSTLVGELCRAWFAGTLLVTLLVLILGTHCVSLIFRLGLIGRTAKEDLCVCIAILSFKLMLLVNPQIRVHREGDWNSLPVGSAAMILMNHASFFDFFLFTSSLPLRLVRQGHCRTVVSVGLTKIPLFGSSIGDHAGSFKVFFQAKGAGFGKGDHSDFSVDRDRQQVETSRMESHIQTGGIVAFCPEGGLNKEPPQLQPFRRGSFAQAVKFRTPLWGAALANCYRCWPRNAKIGGYPCTVGLSIQKLTTPTSDQDVAAVADACQRAMQTQLDALLCTPQVHGPAEPHAE